MTREDAQDIWKKASSVGFNRAAADARTTMHDDETSRYASGVMLAVSEPLVYVVAQNDSDIDAGEQNQGRIAEMGHLSGRTAYLCLWAFEKRNRRTSEWAGGQAGRGESSATKRVHLVLHVDGSLGGAQVEKTLDCLVVCKSMQVSVNKVLVVDEFESKSHKPILYGVLV